MTQNVTTEDEVSELIERLYLPGANDTVLQNVLDMYPENLDLVSNIPELRFGRICTEPPLFRDLHSTHRRSTTNSTC